MTSFKRLITTAVATLAFLLTTSITTPAPQPAEAATWTSPDVFVDGELLHFDVRPQIQNGRTLVPMRMIFESLGADVSWEPKTRTAVAVKDGVTIRLPIDSKTVTRNGQTITLDVPAKIVDTRTMVPARFVSEAFGDKVEWDDRKYQVHISTNQAPKVRIVGTDRLLEEGQTQNLQARLLAQQVTAQVEQAAGFTFTNPVWVYLSNSDQGYEQAIRTYGQDDNQTELVADTSSGVTYDYRVMIPLHRQANMEDTVSTVAHELVHVLLNQNKGSNLPSWVHEGFAWQVGLDIGYRHQPLIKRQQIEGLVREEILGALDAGEYRPLINSAFTKIIALSKASYNLELQDYLAYQYLTERFGQDAFRQYLKAHANGSKTPFETTFGLTPQAFEEAFNARLQQELQKTSQGVEVTLQVSDAFTGGQLRILPEGQTGWKSLRLQPGQHTFRIYKNGRVEGLPTYDGYQETEADPTTVYLYLEPSAPQQEQGILADGGGLAIASTYGEYWLTNAWLYEVNSEDALYPDVHEIFGVEIVSIQAIR